MFVAEQSDYPGLIHVRMAGIGVKGHLSDVHTEAMIFCLHGPQASLHHRASLGLALTFLNNDSSFQAHDRVHVC